MNKTDLIQKVKALEGLTQDERAYLINLVNTKKKYGLVWEDKPEKVEEQLRENLPVLKEVKDKAIINGEEHPNHILIEGDNLHALTALTFTHEGKIDVIYIDPPYNTGNKDFKYNDTFVDREDSFKHSKWLSFMDKRLRAAKRLLNEKGVIFISIDDYEQATLKLLCDEIFSETNFIGNIIWQRAFSPINLKKTLSQNHDFILAYCKQDFPNLELNKLPRSEEASNRYKNPDNDTRGPWTSGDLSVGPPIEKNIYEIETPSGRKVLPPTGYSWRLSKERFDEFVNDNRIWFGPKGDGVPRIKRFLTDVKDGVVALTLWTHQEVGHTQDAKKELKEVLHENERPFETVKPIKLIDRILKLTTDKNKPYTILDFFAGSGTTLHATMALNAEDGGNRQCILVTNNENNICEEVTYERNKRVIQGYTNAKGVAIEGLSNNNLRYYKSEFVPSQKSEINKRLLTKLSTDLLCIKEDCYKIATEQFDFSENECQLYSDGCGKYLVIVYHSRNLSSVCEQLISVIPALPVTEKVRLYVFSPEKETLLEEFEEIKELIEAVPLPEAIYNAYRATFRTLKLDKRLYSPIIEDGENEGDEGLFANQEEA
jgi:adenine-specific DNA-methyltransferase